MVLAVSLAPYPSTSPTEENTWSNLNRRLAGDVDNLDKHIAEHKTCQDSQDHPLEDLDDVLPVKAATQASRQRRAQQRPSVVGTHEQLQGKRSQDEAIVCEGHVTVGLSSQSSTSYPCLQGCNVRGRPAH